MGSRFGYPRLNEDIALAFRLWHKGSIAENLGTLGNWFGISRQSVKKVYEAASKFGNSGEGVNLTAIVHEHGVVSGRKLQLDQFEHSSGSVQQGIEPPSTGDVVGLQLPDKIIQESLPVVAGNTCP